MKIIKQGVNPVPPPEPPWWVGIMAECDRCHTQYQLDDVRDVLSPTVDEATGFIPKVAFLCITCRKFVYIERPIATTSLQKFETNRGRASRELNTPLICPGCFQAKPCRCNNCSECGAPDTGGAVCYPCQDKARIA